MYYKINVEIFKYKKNKHKLFVHLCHKGVAKIASSIASKEIFSYRRIFFLTVRSGFNRFLLC